MFPRLTVSALILMSLPVHARVTAPFAMSLGHLTLTIGMGLLAEQRTDALVMLHETDLDRSWVAPDVYPASLEDADDIPARVLLNVESLGPLKDPDSASSELERAVSFARTVHATIAVLNKANAMALRSVTFAAMGHGTEGELSLRETFSAYALGIKIYATAHPTADLEEVRLVIEEPDSLANRRVIDHKLRPFFRRGEFFAMARRFRFGEAELTALAKDFFEHDSATLADPARGFWPRAGWRKCVGWLTPSYFQSRTR